MTTSTFNADSQPLQTAVGLMWGWLEQENPQQALTLVKACLLCWPESPVLHLIHCQCLALLGLPWPRERTLLDLHAPPEWSILIKRLEMRQKMRSAYESTGGRQRIELH
jgi:hypothetical protein